jgi:hypothetical protein
MMDCTHPARPDYLRITDPSETLNCPDFSSIGGGGPVPRRLLRVIRTGAIAAVLGFAAMFGTAHLYRARTQSGPSVPLRCTVSAPSEASADTGLVVRVLVLNEGEEPADGVQVIIGGKSMRNFTCQAVDPPEAFAEATARSACATIGRIEPGSIGAVTFTFAPKEPGEVKLVAQVTAANAKAPEIIPIEAEILP